MLGWVFFIVLLRISHNTISDVLLEREGVGLFVIYHSYVILVVETGANNSELIPKKDFLFKVIPCCEDCFS